MKLFNLLFALFAAAFLFGSCTKRVVAAPSSWGSLQGGINISDDNKTEEISRESSYDIDPQISDLSIDADMGTSPLNLVIEKSSDNKIHVIETFNENYFTCDAFFEAGKMLRIKTAAKEYSGIIQINPLNANVIVKLPLEAALTFESINGSLELNNTDLTSVRTNITNGDVLITDGNISGDVNIETTNGAIYYSGVINGTTVDLESTNGDINIYIKKGSDVAVDIESDNSYPFYNGGIIRSRKIAETINTGSGKLSVRNTNGHINCNVE